MTPWRRSLRTASQASDRGDGDAVGVGKDMADATCHLGWHGTGATERMYVCLMMGANIALLVAVAEVFAYACLCVKCLPHR